MDYIVRSAAGALLQDNQALNKPHTLLPNSTLNQKFDIQNNVLPSGTDVYGINYAVIGNKGHSWQIDDDQVPYIQPIQHLPEHSGLYGSIPFVMRRPADDLDATTRAQYRLRKIITIPGDANPWVAYYAKVLDKTNTSPILELRTVGANGTVTSTPFSYTLEDLSPTPPAIPPGTALVNSGNYLAATGKVPFVLTAFDVQELLNVSNVLYGNYNKALISEVGLCHGVDKSVPGDFNGTTLNYTEAIGCQIHDFVSTFFAAQFQNQGTTMTFDVGSVEPMLTLQPISS